MSAGPKEDAAREQDQLAAAAASLEVHLDGDASAQMLGYLALLRRWNSVYNLTSIRDPAEMLGQHLFDSLAVVSPLRRRLRSNARATSPVTLLDVGSGAGLPGVVIAIVCPEVQVTCIDAVAKKTAFVRQVQLQLGLRNLSALHGRVESLPDGDSFDVISARAFAALGKLVELSAKALAPDGVWLAMKAGTPDDEIAALPAIAEVFHVEPIAVPTLDAKRCIVWMRKTRNSPTIARK